jgi:hypothetical protein
MAKKQHPRTWRRPLVGPCLLVLLVFQAACARSASVTPRRGPPAHKERNLSGALEYEVQVLEPGPRATEPVILPESDFQRALTQLAPELLRREGPPREVARALLAASLEQQAETGSVSAGGDYLTEVYRDRGLSMVPRGQWGPVVLTPVAEEALRAQYQQWCQKRGGGDCLGLFDDGASFLMEDRRTLALGLALDAVLDETRQAMVRELDPRLLVGLVVWTAAMYLGLLLVPEPTTKALAASLTVILVAWLGLSTFWELIDGWAVLAHRAHEATTFEELREAGQEYARVLGTTAARTLILGVATVAAGPLGQLAGRVRAMPGYSLAWAQWRDQGGAVVLQRVSSGAGARESAFAMAVAGVEVVTLSPQGPLAVVMLKTGFTRGGGEPRGGRSTTVLRHRGGNKQVLTDDGQRWHLPRDRAPGDIPRADPVGDQLQDAVTQASREWGPHELTENEALAIKEALKQGKSWLARLLEREARGRFVHARVKEQFERIYRFNHQGVDVVDLKTGLRYEILSGTESNLALHGQRMSGEFFRMLTF